MDSSILIPDSRYHFTLPDGTAFALDPIETLRTIDAIAERCKDRMDYRHLDEFSAYVHEETGVTLNRSQADWLMDTLRVEYHTQKKERLAPLLLQPSTGSTHSDCPLDN